MLPTERAYQFRSRLDQVHRPIAKDCAPAPAGDEEIEITDGWGISYPLNASETTMMAVQDLADYFREAFGLILPLRPGKDEGIVLVDNDASLQKQEFTLKISAKKMVVAAPSPRMLRRGIIRLEDQMNLRNAPILKIGDTKCQKLITPRIVHSGWGIELFPDSQLNAILHAGFDAIAVFTKGFDKTNIGTLDFADLIRRATKYDIDFYFYSYLPSFKHPDDPDAKEFFESVYTRLFERYPDAAGVMLVGESAEFPSKDPATTGKRYTDSQGSDGIRATKPSPGWWPCSDYPAWLTCVRDAVRKARPDARIIFNTYNWGWAPYEVREKFLSKVPEGITIQVTYDIFSAHKFLNFTEPVMDYSITATEPGYYFDSECQAAAKYHLPLLATANTAGTTWDFGDVPYIPVPQRWIKRFKTLDRYRTQCGLDAFYDNHHYGWWPSVITELGKNYFYSPQADLDELLKKLAASAAGKGAEKLISAWDYWSDAFDYLPATNEDQYGPLRVGPSYPLIFQPNITRTMAKKEIQFPTDPGAHFGYHIIKTLYQPYENSNQPPAFLRYPREVEALKLFLIMWRKGIALYEEAIALAPASKQQQLERECNIGRFIEKAALTTFHVKQWWQLNHALQSAEDIEEANGYLDNIEALAKAEMKNAQAAIPLVNADSRLGWEPSMEYVCDQWHLEWKIRQVKSALEEVAEYRKLLKLG